MVKLEIPFNHVDKNSEIHHLTGNKIVTELNKISDQWIDTYEGKAYILFRTESFSEFVEVFTAKVNVITDAGLNGTITLSGNTEVTKGENLELIITPNTGYEVDKLYDNGADKTLNISNGKYILNNVLIDRNITVSFKKVKQDESTGNNIDISNKGTTVPNITSGKSHIAYMFGYSDGTFRPNAYITRAEVAAILARVDTRYQDYVVYK